MDMKKSLVTIVMATYNPYYDWFEKQLISLNNQDYDNLELIVLDDCSPKIASDKIKKTIAHYITNFPFKFFVNEKNIGSTKTFEKLTSIASGEYIAYCDQDDIWESYKISKSVETIKKNNALLVCSDVKIIDGNGNITANSITEIRKRHVFKHGENLADSLLFRNFVIGCTILIDRNVAQSAIPFPNNMIHDHWLALYTSIHGKLEVCNKPLIKYRIHGRNQTGVLAGINSKQDYYDKRIEPFYCQLCDISKREKINCLSDAFIWAKARKAYFNGKLSAVGTIFKYRNFNKSVAFFEIAIKFMPNFIFKYVLKKLK